MTTLIFELDTLEYKLEATPLEPNWSVHARVLARAFHKQGLDIITEIINSIGRSVETLSDFEKESASCKYNHHLLIQKLPTCSLIHLRFI